MRLMKIHQMIWNDNGGLREQATLFVLEHLTKPKSNQSGSKG